MTKIAALACLARIGGSKKIIRRRRKKRMEANNFTQDLCDFDEDVEFPQILDRAVEIAFPGRTFRQPRLVPSLISLFF